MIARIDAFAGALAGRGIGVGDVVGLLAPNSSAFAVAFHGILRAGATATTINALFTAKDIAKQLDRFAGQAARDGHAAARPGQRGRDAGRHGRRRVIVLDGQAQPRRTPQRRRPDRPAGIPRRR